MFAWRRRLSRGAEMFKPVKIVSLAVRSAGGQSDSVIELYLPGGRHLIVRRGFDRQLLLDVVEALEPKSSRLEPKPAVREMRS
jgi:hypothetical protein